MRERHGHAHVGLKSRTYRSWLGMKQRCTNRQLPDYWRYGGRGILVCKRWLDSFSAFLSDMGDRPAGLELDRINNDGNYEPGNCRWATRSEQVRNRSVSVGDVARTLIRQMRRRGASVRDIAWAFGFGRSTVTEISGDVAPSKTTCSQGHPWVESNLYTVHERSGRTTRKCRVCVRIRGAERFRRKRLAKLGRNPDVLDAQTGER